MTDADWMRMAIEEARKGDAPYGAVIVLDASLVATGFNTTRRHKDATAHAEVNAIRHATTALSSRSLEGCTLYATGEPCAMCAGAAVWAGISRIVFGATFAQLAGAGQHQIGISCKEVIEAGFREIDVLGGVLADEVLGLFV
ncbi:MAG: nucleoside deaminase [Rhodothermales bacterium]|nr:nucleoside deaminase [Rhodothermales bacterium]